MCCEKASLHQPGRGLFLGPSPSVLLYRMCVVKRRAYLGLGREPLFFPLRCSPTGYDTQFLSPEVEWYWRLVSSSTWGSVSCQIPLPWPPTGYDRRIPLPSYSVIVAPFDLRGELLRPRRTGPLGTVRCTSSFDIPISRGQLLM